MERAGGGRAPQGTFTGPQSVAGDVFSTVPENFEDFRAEVDEWIDAGWPWRHALAAAFARLQALPRPAT